MSSGAAIDALCVEAFAVGSHGLFLCRGFYGVTRCMAAVEGDVVVEKRAQDVFDAVLATKLASAAVVDPRALVLSVTALYFFVFSSKNLLFQYLCALSLIDAGNLEDLGSIEPAVRAAAHDGDTVDLHFVDGYARVDGL